jgi:hypothetical protein
MQLAAASSEGLRLSAVVSHSPGQGVSVGDGRCDIEVSGGICKEMETLGPRETLAIFEVDIFMNSVYIARASDEFVMSSE